MCDLAGSAKRLPEKIRNSTGLWKSASTNPEEDHQFHS